jgi:outer membrane protein TolC
MIPLLNRAGRLGAVGAVLLACTWPAAWSQTQGATAPSSAHVHGLGPGTPSNAALSAKPVPSSPTWQDANRAVGQFPRGHVDLLRWEQKNLPPLPDSSAHPDAGKLTLALAMRLALQDEALWLKPGMSAAESAAVGQQVTAVRLDVQRLWVNAVVARQSVAHSGDVLAVAQAGAELGQRMAQVGNWSRARQMEQELMLWDARARADKAQLQADRALQALWQRIGAGMPPQALAQQLPPHLPSDLPPHPLVNLPAHSPVDGQAEINSETVAALQTQALMAHLRWPVDELQARRLSAGQGLTAQELQAAQQALQALAGQELPMWDPRTMRWGHVFENALQARLRADRLARQVRADVHNALAAFRLASQTAQHTQAQVLRLHTELSQETLLRYNGMLKSTWDLLASVRTRIDSVDAALQAQRQLWLAHADLMAVLAGLPYADSASATDATNPSNTRTAGH